MPQLTGAVPTLISTFPSGSKRSSEFNLSFPQFEGCTLNSFQKLVSVFFCDKLRSRVYEFSYGLTADGFYRCLDSLLTHVCRILGDDRAHRSGLYGPHGFLAGVEPDDKNLSAQVLRRNSLHSSKRHLIVRGKHRVQIRM